MCVQVRVCRCCGGNSSADSASCTVCHIERLEQEKRREKCADGGVRAGVIPTPPQNESRSVRTEICRVARWNRSRHHDPVVSRRSLMQTVQKQKTLHVTLNEMVPIKFWPNSVAD